MKNLSKFETSYFYSFTKIHKSKTIESGINSQNKNVAGDGNKAI